MDASYCMMIFLCTGHNYSICWLRLFQEVIFPVCFQRYSWIQKRSIGREYLYRNWTGVGFFNCI